MRIAPNNRVALSCDIATQVMLNPEAMINFICIASDEISLVEYQRIYCRFFDSLSTIKNKTNLKS